MPIYLFNGGSISYGIDAAAAPLHSQVFICHNQSEVHLAALWQHTYQLQVRTHSQKDRMSGICFQKRKAALWYIGRVGNSWPQSNEAACRSTMTSVLKSASGVIQHTGFAVPAASTDTQTLVQTLGHDVASSSAALDSSWHPVLGVSGSLTTCTSLPPLPIPRRTRLPQACTARQQSQLMKFFTHFLGGKHVCSWRYNSGKEVP